MKSEVNTLRGTEAIVKTTARTEEKNEVVTETVLVYIFIITLYMKLEHVAQQPLHLLPPCTKQQKLYLPL